MSKRVEAYWAKIVSSESLTLVSANFLKRAVSPSRTASITTLSFLDSAFFIRSSVSVRLAMRSVTRLATVPDAGDLSRPRGCSRTAGSIDLSRVRKAFASVLSELSSFFQPTSRIIVMEVSDLRDLG